MVDALVNLTPYLADTDVFVRGAHIICFPGKITFIAKIWLDASSGFCLFLQGDSNSINQIIYPDGSSLSAVDGKTVKDLMPKLRAHGCNSCSSIPISPDNDPHKKGILTLNFVKQRSGCGDSETGTNLCRPTFAAGSRGNPYKLWQDEQNLQNGNVAVVSGGGGGGGDSGTSGSTENGSENGGTFGGKQPIVNTTAQQQAQGNDTAKPLQPCGSAGVVASGVPCAPPPSGVVAVTYPTGSPDGAADEVADSPGYRRVRRDKQRDINYEYGRGRYRGLEGRGN